MVMMEATSSGGAGGEMVHQREKAGIPESEGIYNRKYRRKLCVYMNIN